MLWITFNYIWIWIPFLFSILILRNKNYIQEFSTKNVDRLPSLSLLKIPLFIRFLFKFSRLYSEKSPNWFLGFDKFNASPERLSNLLNLKNNFKIDDQKIAEISSLLKENLSEEEFVSKAIKIILQNYIPEKLNNYKIYTSFKNLIESISINPLAWYKSFNAKTYLYTIFEDVDELNFYYNVTFRLFTSIYTCYKNNYKSIDYAPPSPMLIRTPITLLKWKCFKFNPGDIIILMTGLYPSEYFTFSSGTPNHECIFAKDAYDISNKVLQEARRV
jgi:hypothetical protein